MSMGDTFDDVFSAAVTAAGAMSSSDFNCTKYAGVCKPTNKNALATVQEMQRQLNRVAQGKGLSKIAVDGDVGPGTLAQAQKTLGVGTSTSSVSQLAVNAVGATQLAKQLANQAGVPTTVSQPVPVVTPSYIPPGSTVAVPVGSGMLDSMLGGLSSTQKYILVGLAGLIVYKKFIKKKGRRK